MQMMRQLYGTRKRFCVCGYHVYKEIYEAETGETLVCVWWIQGTLMTKTLWLLKRAGKLLDISQKKCPGCVLLFEEGWKRSLLCDYYGS